MDAILTLVADRAATSLTPLDIETVSALSGGREEVVLSPGEAVDIACHAVSPAQFGAIHDALRDRPVDILLTSRHNRRKRVLVADMDSTMVANETLDDIAAGAERLRPGIGEAVAAVTRQSMNGEIDFQTSLRNRVALLKDLPSSLLDTAATHLSLNEGARTLVATMRASGAVTALVSGGFTFFTARVAALCGFSENHANRLIHAGDTLTGTVEEPVLGPDAKLDHLKRIVAAAGLTLNDALTIGDGANDLPMLRAAGLGIAFHAKPVVRREISDRIDHTSLRSALFAQGYSVTDFRE